jgi:hypothetical protein
VRLDPDLKFTHWPNTKATPSLPGLCFIIYDDPITRYLVPQTKALGSSDLQVTMASELTTFLGQFSEKLNI